MQPFGVRLAVVSLVVLIGVGPLAWIDRAPDAGYEAGRNAARERGTTDEHPPAVSRNVRATIEHPAPAAVSDCAPIRRAAGNTERLAAKPSKTEEPVCDG